jgi:hypothetical protein
MTNEIRQGDVLLMRIDSVPVGAEPKNNILAEGEITGHNHKIEGAEVYIKDGSQYVVVKQKAQLVHQEHEAIQEIPAGTYAVSIDKEWSPLANRQVLD